MVAIGPYTTTGVSCLLNAGDMSGSLTSSTYPSRKADIMALHVIWTGTPTGDLDLEVSLNGTDWSIQSTCALAGVAGDVFWDVGSAAVLVRVTWTPSAGSGSLTVLAAGER